MTQTSDHILTLYHPDRVHVNHLAVMTVPSAANGALLVAIAALCCAAPSPVLEPELSRVAGHPPVLL
jgi:hypothetical protein